MDQAKEAGADAAKFQTYFEHQYELYDYTEIIKHGEDIGLPVFSTPVSSLSLNKINEFSSAIKIASRNLTNRGLISAACHLGKPLIVSTGLGTIKDIDTALSWIENEGTNREQVILLHCSSAYPTPLHEANTLSIPFMASRYKCLIGYSNHVKGLTACFSAICLGAAMIEVHFTDDKTRPHRDHQISVNKFELARLRKSMISLRCSMGSFYKRPQPSELERFRREE